MGGKIVGRKSIAIQAIVLEKYLKKMPEHGAYASEVLNFVKKVDMEVLHGPGQVLLHRMQRDTTSYDDQTHKAEY